MFTITFASLFILITVFNDLETEDSASLQFDKWNICPFLLVTKRQLLSSLLWQNEALSCRNIH